MLVLSFLALFTVLTGYLQTPQPDEGAAAHIFQISLVLLGPALLVFLLTADSSNFGRLLRPLIPPALALALAFAALYYLEHVWHAGSVLRNVP